MKCSRKHVFLKWKYLFCKFSIFTCNQNPSNMWISSILGATSIPILLRKTSKWRFQFNPPTHSWKRQGWRNFCCCCKASYTGTIGNRNNCKRPTCYTMTTLFTKIDITIKVTKSFNWVSHMALQAGSLVDGTFEFCSRKFW